LFNDCNDGWRRIPPHSNNWPALTLVAGEQTGSTATTLAKRRRNGHVRAAMLAVRYDPKAPAVPRPDTDWNLTLS
jgi:hypothetical protein